MTPLEEFCTTLSQLSDTLKSITSIEQGRAEAASRKQHRQISSFLNEEQAALLTMKGLEQKRMQQAETLGWKGLTFRQILDIADEEQKKVLLPRFTELDERISLLKEIRQSADRIMKLRIHELETVITMIGGSPKANPSHLFHDKYV